MAMSFGLIVLFLMANLFIIGMIIIFVVFGVLRRNSRIKDIQENIEQLQKDMSELRKEIADLKEQIADLTIKLDNLNI